MCSSPSSLEPLAPGRAAVGVGVDDQLGAAAQRLVAGRVHVAEDHVGLQPRLEHRVGAAVDGDDQRAHVADVGAQRLQVAAVVGRRGRRSATWRSRKRGPRRREARSLPVSSSPSSRTCAIVFSANSAQRLVDPLALLARAARASSSTSSTRPREHVLAVATHLAAVDRHRVAVAEHLEERRRGRVDQQDPGPGQHQRAGVRVAAVGRVGRR